MIAELSTGTILQNRYRIDKVLGQGGCGRTYLALDTQCFNKKCVLKELILQPTHNQEKGLELFCREAEVLYKLDHPQIPKFQANFEDKGRFFLVQDFVDGQSYWSLITRDQTFSEAQIIQWLKDLLPVLSYIHSQGIIHRDISPDNIMLPKGKNQPILIDFGVVKQTIMLSQIHSENISSGGTRVGKYGYSPPELLNSGDCFPNTDLYALAVTALVLLTKKKPADLFDSYEMNWKWQQYINISPSLSSIFSKMLAPIPKSRYKSAGEVLKQLESLEINSNSDSVLPDTVVHPFVAQATEPTITSGSLSNQNAQKFNSNSEDLILPPQNKKPPQKIIFLIGSLSLLLIGGGMLIFSPYITSPFQEKIDKIEKDKKPLW